jgi:hypothetical protein
VHSQVVVPASERMNDCAGFGALPCGTSPTVRPKNENNMRFMMDEYFKDSKLDRINKGLFAFASYNAGPNKIARLRKQASDEGLNPEKRFNNVELIAGREIAAETVTYVSNIYKYFVAFKLVTERAGSRKTTSGKT